MAESRKRKRQEDEETGCKEPANEGERQAGPAKQGIDRCSPEREVRFVRGEKQFLFDEDSQRYLDTMNSVQHVGHCHQAVVAAGARQMAELNTNNRFLHDRMMTFAQKLTSTFPDSLSHCIFVNSKSEANDLALQMASTATGHTHCLSLTGCYHGHLQSLRSLAGENPSSDFSQAPCPDVYSGQFRDPETAGRQYAAELQKVIDHQLTEGKKISSFIHESVMSSAGMVFLPPAFLPAAYRSVREAGGLCIADETESGFGRLGESFWGFQLHGVCPDIVTLGEAMGNGHPVGAIITTAAIAEKFAHGASYFNTFGGNPVSMAIAQSVLEVIEEEKLQENAQAVGGYLLAQLRELAERHECVGDVRGQGLCVGVELVRERDTREPDREKAKEIVAKLLKDHRIAARVDAIRGNVIIVKPPLCVTMDNAKELVSAIDAAILS